MIFRVSGDKTAIHFWLKRTGHEKLQAHDETAGCWPEANHRLDNPGQVCMVLIEVMTGSHLGEGDIIRSDTNFARSPGAMG